MNNLSVREILERFQNDRSNYYWRIAIGEYRKVKYNMDFTNVNCDHYLTQEFLNRLSALSSSYGQLIKEYGTSTISEIILGGMIVTIERINRNSPPPPEVTNLNELKSSGYPFFVGGNRVALV